MDRKHPGPADALERALIGLGGALDYPLAATMETGPDLASEVARRLVEAPAPPMGRRLRLVLGGLGPRDRKAWRPVLRPSWQPVAAAVVAIVVVAGGIVGFSPSARQAVAGWLGLRGVQIKILPTPPTTPPVRPGQELDLGEPVSLARARELVSYALVEPHDSGIGAPDAVYESPTLPGGVVSFVYRARSGIPTSTFTGVSLLFVQFQAEVDRRLLLVKGVGPGTGLQAVTVDGEPGFWISGGAHTLAFRAPGGEPFFDEVRLSGNVLIWQRGSLVLRIEGQIDLARALQIARSVR